ncbi:MAG: MFS transporter [Planctomycetota bacterium]
MTHGTIIKLLDAACTRFTAKPLFAYPDGDGWREIAYGQYREAVSRIACDLVAAGVKPGDRVMLLGAYGPAWCAGYMGIHVAGATVIPMDAQYTAAEVATIHAYTQPAAVLCDAAHRGVLPAGVTPLALDDVYTRTGEAAFAPVPLPDGAPMSIIFTSGTTGDPKGVMLSEANFMANVSFLHTYRGLMSDRDVMLAMLPLHHVYGFTCTFLAPMLIGGTIVFPKTLSGTEIAAAVQARGVTLLVAIPQVLNLFHKKIFDAAGKAGFFTRDLFRTLKDITRWSRKYLGLNPGRLFFGKVHRNFPALRFMTSGGARLEPQILTDLHDLGFNIIEAYGLTETAPIACFNHPRRPVPGSVGTAITGVAVKIDRTDPALEQGEICIKGPIVMMGYYKRPEETTHAIEDGWFRTGDLGYMDARGNVYITGRKKEIIILPNGKNVYPEELEKAYARSQRIAEVCILVTGEPAREQLTAAVFPDMKYFREKQSANIHQDVKYDIETIAAGLPSYQRVTRVEVLDAEFPRTRLGKIKRFKVRELIEHRGAASTPGAARSKDTDDPFLRFLMEELKLDFAPQPEHNLETDLGLDSLGKLELLAAVEKQFGARIPAEQAGTLISVQNLAAAVTASGGAPGGAAGAGFDLPAEVRKPPAVPLRRHVAVGWGFFGGILRFTTHFIQWAFVRFCMRGRIAGLEKLPATGPFIIAPNHQSYFDAVLIYGMLPWRVTRRMYSISLPEIFGRFPLSLVRKPGRVILTGTHETMIESLRYSREVLEMGEPMVVFPEGKRSVDGRVDRPKPGIFMLAGECRAPIVPVHLTGLMALLSRPNPGFRFTPVAAEVLDPIPVAAGDPRPAMDAWHRSMQARDQAATATPAAPPAAGAGALLRAVAWSMFDFANTIFSFIVVTMYLPPLLEKITGSNFLMSTSNVISMIVAGLTAPVLGALTDRSSRAKRWLIAVTVVCCLACAAIGFLVGPETAPSTMRLFAIGSAFVVANFTYQLGLMFYNSFLPTLGTPEFQGKISGLGTALGYVGVLVVMFPAAAVANYAEWLVYPFGAAAFFLFALPMFLLVPERRAVKDEPLTGAVIRQEMGRFFRLFGRLREDKNLRNAFLSSFLAVDAVNTAILFFTTFLINAVFVDRTGEALKEAVKYQMLALTVSAIVMSFVIGWLSDRIGSKKGLMIAIVAMAGASLAGCFLTAGWPFYIIITLCGGAGLSGVWTAGRKLFADIAPPDKVGDYFGLYGLSNKASALGTVIFAAITCYLPKWGLTSEPVAYRIAFAFGVVTLTAAAYFLAKVELKPGSATKDAE